MYLELYFSTVVLKLTLSLKIFESRIRNMAELSSQIEKLDKHNYQPWKFQMRNYLIRKNLWSFITGIELKPVMHATNPTEEQIRNFNQWNEKDKMVMFVLSQNISNSMIGHI